MRSEKIEGIYRRGLGSFLIEIITKQIPKFIKKIKI